MISAALLLFTAISAGGVPGCQVVDDDQIRMRDLAAADQRFAGAEPGQRVGFAPQPGATRIFWPAELVELARHNAVVSSDPFQQICFARKAKLLTAEEWITAIRAWTPEGAQVEILEMSSFPAPSGVLDIPRPANAHAAIDGSLLLRGSVRYGVDHRFPVWARVRVAVKQMVVVATEAIPAGTEIRADQMRLEERSGGIESLRFADQMAGIVGKTTRKHFSPGEPILLASLEVPLPVKRGAMVHVEVRNGATHLSLDAVAETNARVGVMVTVRNPASGKAFQARVTGPNAAVVIPPGAQIERSEQQ